MPRFAPGETVWTDDPLSPNDGVGEFEVLDVLEDFDEDYTDYVLLLATPGDREKSFCVSETRAFRTKEEAEACSRRRDRTQEKKDRLAGHKFSAKDAMLDMFTLSSEGFRDKYMGILFSDDEEFKAFADRVNGAVEAVFREQLVEVRPIGEKPQ